MKLCPRITKAALFVYFIPYSQTFNMASEKPRKYYWNVLIERNQDVCARFIIPLHHKTTPNTTNLSEYCL